MKGGGATKKKFQKKFQVKKKFLRNFFGLKKLIHILKKFFKFALPSPPGISDGLYTRMPLHMCVGLCTRWSAYYLYTSRDLLSLNGINKDQHFHWSLLVPKRLSCHLLSGRTRRKGRRWNSCTTTTPGIWRRRPMKRRARGRTF